MLESCDNRAGDVGRTADSYRGIGDTRWHSLPADPQARPTSQDSALRLVSRAVRAFGINRTVTLVANSLCTSLHVMCAVEMRSENVVLMLEPVQRTNHLAAPD